MKLLKKEQVLIIKASEKKQEIDVGLKLAQRIDELREAKNKEETNLTKFKEETSKIVQKEIDDLIVKKNSLDYEVRVLEGKNRLLKKPFQDEWESISNKTIADLENLDASLQKRQHDIDKTEVELYERARLFFAEQNSLRDKLKIAEANERETSEKLNEVSEIWSKTKIREAQVNSELDAKVNNMNKREAEILSKERDFSIREEAIQGASKALAQREKFINDKYKTLMRTEAALQAKHKK